MIKERDDLKNYRIYSDGRIWSKTKKRFLKYEVTGTGHFQVELQRNGKPYHVRVHRLIFETFVRPLNIGEIVHHLDHNPANNDVSNLVDMKRSEHTAMHNVGNSYHQGHKHSQQTKQKMKQAWIRRKEKMNETKEATEL